MNGPTMRERADGSARCTLKPPRSTERGTITCAMTSLERASPKAGSLAGKKLMRQTSSSRAWERAMPPSGLESRLPPRLCLRHQLGDKARLREGRGVDLGRPIHRLETAGLAVALGDGLHRMLSQPLIVGRNAHGHVAADIDRNRGDIAAGVREQPPELRHGRRKLVLLEERHAVLRHQDTALFHATPAA